MKITYNRNILLVLVVLLFIYFYIVPILQCSKIDVPQIVTSNVIPEANKIVQKVSVVKNQIDEYLDGFNKPNYHQENIWLGTADLHPAAFSD